MEDSPKGVVLNQQGLPVPHALILAPDTSLKVRTDLEGEFPLEQFDSADSIVVQAAGYDQKVLKHSKTGELTISLNHPEDHTTAMRKRESFDFGWKFIHQDGEFQSFDLNDSQWRILNLPHDYSIEQDYDLKKSDRKNAYLSGGGVAWYRKHFSVPADATGKTVQIEFDGIYFNAEIWVNGHWVGQQREGYTSKYFDLTPHLNFGGNNVLAVKVNNDTLKGPNSRWYTGSGIYRHTWLITADKLRVKNWGTFITTVEASTEQAKINVQTTVLNDYDVAQNFTLETVVKDADGQEVGRVESPLYLNSASQKEIQQSLTLNSPELWSPDSPAMYYAQSRILVEDELVDDYISSFGVRTFEVSKEKGFVLNGHPIKFKGVCLHHDGGTAVGAAVPEAIWERRLRNLKKIGVNAIRTAHNPMAPEYLDMLDRMGFLVMSEFIDKWDAPYNRFHPEDWQQDFTNTIERDRNHPSHIFWTVGNEHGKPGTMTLRVSGEGLEPATIKIISR